jgi:hypothetical protein
MKGVSNLDFLAKLNSRGQSDYRLVMFGAISPELSEY